MPNTLNVEEICGFPKLCHAKQWPTALKIKQINLTGPYIYNTSWFVL